MVKLRQAIVIASLAVITGPAMTAHSLVFGGGTWNGSGLDVDYTLLGDARLDGEANLDGTVNGTDFAILATNFNQDVSGWHLSDFDYDSKANGSDFAFLATNFNSGASTGSDADLLAFAAANGLTSDTSGNVPEPASAALLAVGAMGLLGRRRAAHR